MSLFGNDEGTPAVPATTSGEVTDSALGAERDTPTATEAATPEQSDRRPLGDDITRPASFADPVGEGASGTFDVPGAVEVPAIPVELFQLPARKAAQLFVEAARSAPNLRVDQDPRRTSKNQAHYIRAYVQALAEALQRL